MSSVQALQHEGGHGSTEREAPSTQGLYAGSDRVTFIRSGWAEPVAFGYGLSRQDFVLAGVECVVFSFKTVRLNHAAGMFLLQGASFAQIFDGCFFDVMSDRSRSIFEPLLLVRASFPDFTSPVLLLQEVALAMVKSEQPVEEVRKKIFVCLTSK